MQIGPNDNVRPPSGTPDFEDRPTPEKDGENGRKALNLEKVKAIRKRISSGFYSRKDIMEKMADKLTNAREVASNCFEPLSPECLDAHQSL